MTLMLLAIQKLITLKQTIIAKTISRIISHKVKIAKTTNHLVMPTIMTAKMIKRQIKIVIKTINHLTKKIVKKKILLIRKIKTVKMMTLNLKTTKNPL